MSEEKSFFYANALELALSPYDISLNFIRNEPRKGVEEGESTEPIRGAALLVSMSPMHAKAMLPGLFKAVADYERTFGTIPVSSEIQNLFSQTLAAKDK